MPATIEELNIILGALDSCKTTQEIVSNVRLPLDIVTECLAHLRKTGRISKDEFTDIYCPIERIADEISSCCSSICDAMKE